MTTLTGKSTTRTMKFKAVDPDGKYPMAPVYTPKNKKQAEQLMALHRSLGDDIDILEEGFDNEE